MSLEGWLDYIHKSHPKEIELGLDRVQSVWSGLELGLASNTPKVITVAGTNGKGSTVAMIEAGLFSLGYQVGSYTSPHIHLYNERVKINGIAVNDAQLIRAFEQVESARKAIPLTYFEFGTLAALALLFDAGLDVICLEIGLGGRLDAVNIVDPDIAIITSVGLDHTDWLGDDLQQIGREKAGILRAGRPALLGENLPESVYDIAKSINASARTYQVDFELGFRHSRLTIPANNIALAFEAIRLIDGPFDVGKVEKAINELELPGRMEKFHLRGRDIFCDVAHNSHAAKHLAEVVCSLKSGDVEVFAVYSSLLDKDVLAVVSTLSEIVDKWFIAPLAVDRAMAKDVLLEAVYEGLTKERFETVGGGKENVLSFGSIEKALAAATDVPSTKTVIIVVFGSFYVVESARNVLMTLNS